MFKIPITLITIIIIGFAGNLKANNPDSLARHVLETRPEVKVLISSKPHSVNWLSNRYSIGKIYPDSVLLYLNRQQYNNFITEYESFRVVAPDTVKQELLKSTGVWDEQSYPSYSQYLAFSDTLVAANNSLCQLYLIGNSIGNKKILCYCITAKVSGNIAKPKVFFTSSMHGDELTGYFVMLRLAKYLCSQYGSDATITNLLDKCEIWINPLANPDGAYYGGTDNVVTPIRNNLNGCDLNRNFPDPRLNNLPSECNEIQPENTAMIDFMKQQGFVLSANFHGGAELVNYPWDAPWNTNLGMSDTSTHADNNWFKALSEQYVDSARKYGPANYFPDYGFMNGTVLGYKWYIANGSRQDYVSCNLHGREVTIEISDKLPSDALLNTYWEANKPAILGYAKYVLTGIYGRIIDIDTQQPIKNIKVSIPSYDKYNSEVYTNDSGYFYRLLLPGYYNLQFEKQCISTFQKTYSVAANSNNFETIQVERTCKDRLYLPNIICKVSPSVFQQSLMVSFNNNLTSILTFLLLNIKGETVIKTHLLANSNFEINTSSVSKGLYLYKIIDNLGNTWTGKVMKLN